MDTRIRKVLAERGLTSFMNNTKWAELCAGALALRFPPPYQAKYLFEDSPGEELEWAPWYLGDWGRTPEGTPDAYIEWIKIAPRHTQKIAPKQCEILDCTEELRALLLGLRIPFVEEAGFFTVYGHGSGVVFSHS